MTGTTPTGRVIGIDLGTTNTLAAYADGRVSRVIPTERGGNLLPSVVAFAGTRVLVGQPAKDQLLIHPAETISGSKRLVGRPFHSPQIQKLKRRLAYEVVEGADGFCAVRAGGEVHALTEISSILLAQIGRYASAHLGGPLDGVVISVPAYYPLSQRDAVRRAAKEAGLDVWRLVNEPTAAAIAYGIAKPNQRLMVFDLGGGTFDVSILEIQQGTFQVLATGGDGFLGGVDFDIRLTDHLIERFEQEEGINIRDDAVVVQRLLSAAETAKMDLSLLQHAEVRLPFVATKRGAPVDLALHVSRQMLQKLTEDLVERASRIVDEVLTQAGLRHDQIDDVVLAGGQTRMPLIQARLEKTFGRPAKKGVNPDEVVAQGAAQLGRALAGGNGVRLLDVLSVPLGIGRRTAAAVTFEAVIAKNVTLPCEARVEVTTHADNQTVLAVDLFQGAARDLTQVDYLGTAHVENIAPGPAGTQRVGLVIGVDAEGLLSVRSADRKTTLPVLAGSPTLRPGDGLDDPTAPNAPKSTSGGGVGVPGATKPGLLQRLFKRN